MSNVPSKKMNRRIIAIALILAIGGSILLSGVLAKVQVIDHDFYSQKALAQQTVDTSIPAKRGSILDRNGKVLAQSASVWDIILDPSSIEENDEETRILVSKKLSEILDVDYDTIYAKTKKTNKYERIKRQVEKAQTDLVKEFISENKIKCISFEENTKRYYPYGSFASHILGFTGSDGNGLEGIEAYYNTLLKGTDGRILSTRSSLTGQTTSNNQNRIEPINGSYLYLTIDEGIQSITEKYLEWGCERAKAAEGGTAIVVNVKNGAIYALANYPNYNPNSPYEITNQSVLDELEKLKGEEYDNLRRKTLTKMWSNKAVTETYDPGSVFKMFTMSMALEEGLVTLDSQFTCSGGTTVMDRHIGCWYTSGHGHENLSEILWNSCNPGFIQLSRKIGIPTFCKYAEAYGFLSKTGIDVSGESAGVFFDQSKMGAVELAVASFGQTFTVTPMQVITGICAIANGGYLVQPHLLERVADENGKTISKTQTIVKRQVISNETSKKMCTMLAGVVQNGTGKNAYVSGYRVGGKTGTSQKIQKINETGDEDLRIASFAAIAPSDDPEIAIIVIIDEPLVSNRGGSACSAPVVAKILEESLPLLGVEPSYTEAELAKLDKTVPDTIGFTTSSAKTTISEAGFTYKLIGNGDEIVDQMPRQGESIPARGIVALVTEGEEITTVKVPDLTGYSASEATSRLNNLGLNIRIKGTDVSGSGVTVNSQSVAPGTEVVVGTIVSVTFLHYDAVQ